MSRLLRGIGRIVRPIVGNLPGPVGTIGRGAFAIGDAINRGRRPNRPAVNLAPGIPGTVPGLPGGFAMPTPPPQPTPPPPTIPRDPRPVGPGPGSGAVTVAGVPGQVVAVALPAVAGRLAQAFARFSQGLGGYLTLDAINELFRQPFGAWPGDALGAFRSFMNTSEAQSLLSTSSGVSGLFPQAVIVDPIIDTIHRAPRGYVIVEYPENSGRKMAMLKTVARQFGYWKPAAKPPISATEYKQAKAADKVGRKLMTVAKNLDHKPISITQKTCRTRR